MMVCGPGVEQLGNLFVPCARLSNESHYRWYPEHDKKYSHDLHFGSPPSCHLPLVCIQPSFLGLSNLRCRSSRYNLGYIYRATIYVRPMYAAGAKTVK
jgi:hypothetical protein